MTTSKSLAAWEAAGAAYYSLARRSLDAVAASGRADDEIISIAEGAYTAGEPGLVILLAVGEAIGHNIPLPASMVEEIREFHDEDDSVTEYIDQIPVIAPELAP